MPSYPFLSYSFFAKCVVSVIGFSLYVTSHFSLTAFGFSACSFENLTTIFLCCTLDNPNYKLTLNSLCIPWLICGGIYYSTILMNAAFNLHLPYASIMLLPINYHVSCLFHWWSFSTFYIILQGKRVLFCFVCE